jgi:NADPH:quinone reductase-like Zn-dependent oxidoreductase
MKIANEKGADVILDISGAETLYKSLNCIGFRGLILCIGYVFGGLDKPDVSRLNLNVLDLRRTVTLKGGINSLWDRFEKMCCFYERYKIYLVVDRVFSFKDAKEVIEYVTGRLYFGKVVIRVE